MPAPVIGLTGGIATGKSTVSNYFQKLGITIVDADAIAKLKAGIIGISVKIMPPGERLPDNVRMREEGEQAPEEEEKKPEVQVENQGTCTGTACGDCPNGEW